MAFYLTRKDISKHLQGEKCAKCNYRSLVYVQEGNLPPIVKCANCGECWKLNGPTTRWDVLSISKRNRILDEIELDYYERQEPLQLAPFESMRARTREKIRTYMESHDY